jgi:hypothetical protein
VGQGGAVLIVTALSIQSPTIVLGDNNSIINTFSGQNAYFRGATGVNTTYTVTNAVTIMGNTVLDNGSGDAHLTFTGGITLAAGSYTVGCNANIVNVNSSITGPGGMNFGPGNASGAGWATFSLNAVNTYTGGTSISGVSSVLTANSPGALGTGNVTINSGALQCNFSNTMAATATLTLFPAIGAGQVSLNYTGTQVVSGLYLGNAQLPPGIYGTGPNATQTNPNGVFTGPGYLEVTFPITSETVVGNQLQITWPAVGGIQYEVLTTTSLAFPETWTVDPGSPVTPGATGPYTYTLSGNVSPTPPNPAQVFVSVRSP